MLQLGKSATVDLQETEKFGAAIKNSRYRKTYHLYPSVLEDDTLDSGFLGNHVIVEINTYGNPFPFIKLPVKSFIAEMMYRRGLSSLIEELDMEPFELNVLDKRQTLCEKIVSLLRFSFEENAVARLASKIRHFYDIHFLLSDYECKEYLNTRLKADLRTLVEHDKREFDRPPLWRTSSILDSPLLVDFENVWRKISPVYLSEVGALTYGNASLRGRYSTFFRDSSSYS